MRQVNVTEYQKIELEELKAKLLIFQAKMHDPGLTPDQQALFAAKARKTAFRISRLKAETGDSESSIGWGDSATRRRKSDGHV